MLQDRDFIITGLPPWDLSIGSNAKDIALEISKKNRVLYVNTPLVKWSKDIYSKKNELQYRIRVLKNQQPLFRRINHNLWILDCPFTVFPVNGFPDGVLFDFFNYINNRKIFRFISDSAKMLEFKNVIHLIDNDIYRSFYADSLLKAGLRIYNLRDNLSEVDFWRKHSLRLEPKLIKKCDLVLCNSLYLMGKAKRYNSNSYYIGQGFDPFIYSEKNYIVPDDIERIRRPIIGYIGTITSMRLDPNLIFKLAQNNHDLSFVLVGPTDTTFLNHKLKTLSNVFFLGGKEPMRVPHYINSFDICINPQIVNSLTIGNYPRKIDEYLAMGKPVIATKTDAMMLFDGYVYLCDNEFEYQEAIDTILKLGVDNGKEERQKYAYTHTWEVCVDRIYNLINNFENEFKNNQI